jgi:hypothetical protein
MGTLVSEQPWPESAPEQGRVDQSDLFNLAGTGDELDSVEMIMLRLPYIRVAAFAREERSDERRKRISA